MGKKHKFENIKGGLYTLPAMLVLIMFLLVPLIYTVYLSFYKVDYLVKSDFVGFANYVNLLTDKTILYSFMITIVITIISTAISMVLGLILALWIDRKSGIFAYSIEIIGLIPWVISMVVAGLLWRWLFNTDMGLFNTILRTFGIAPIAVIQQKNSAIVALIFVLAWRTIGYAMIMLLAGLKGLDGNLIEAAKIDGANSLQTLFRIKLPMIKTPMLLSAIVLTVSNFTNNTVPKVLTSGGPNDATNVITLQQYNMSFRYYQFGLSSALSILIMLVTTLMIIAYIKASKYKI